MQRCVIAIFAGQPSRSRSGHSPGTLDGSVVAGALRRRRDLVTRPASPLLSFRHQYEALRRFHVQLGTLLVADHHSFLCRSVCTPTLIRRAGQNPLYARKIRRQLLAARMLSRLLRGRAMRWRELALRPARSTSLATEAQARTIAFAAPAKVFLRPHPYFSIHASAADALPAHESRSSAYSSLHLKLCDEYEIGLC